MKISGKIILTAGLAGAAVPSAFAQQGSNKEPENRPNVIFIMADDLGYECIGAYGGPYHTPNIDAMAREGILFTDFHSQPLSTPTRVQVMTGKYNHKNYVEFGYINPDEHTFGHLAQKAGYATAVAGKWQLGQEESLPSLLGFEEYSLWQFTQRSICEQRYANARVEVNGSMHPHSADMDHYGPRMHQEFVLDYISRHKDEPFFLYYPTPLVHSPFQPVPGTASWENREMRLKQNLKNFAFMVEELDREVGEIVDRLKQEGIYEHTVLIFAGDNGTNRNITTTMKDGRSIQGGKGIPTDAGTHVPLVISWPESGQKGVVRNQLVDMTDLLPTFADLFQVNVPAEWDTDGISIYPALQGKKGRERQWIFCHYTPLNKGHHQKSDTRFIYNKEYKLYFDGRFYCLSEDILEEHPISPRTRAEKKAYRELKQLLDSFPAWKPGDPGAPRTGTYKAASVEPKGKNPANRVKLH